MTVKRTERTAAADSAPIAPLLNPASAPFLVGQRLAFEAARFWARRMHAYADQLETLADCTSPDDLARAQSRFLERMREDYAAEGKLISAVLSPEQRGREEGR